MCHIKLIISILRQMTSTLKSNASGEIHFFAYNSNFEIHENDIIYCVQSTF